MIEKTERARTVIAANFACCVCGCDEVRHFFSIKDYNHDIRIQNLLCLKCYIEAKYDPATFVPSERLPVMPYPERYGAGAMEDNKGYR